MTNQERAEQLVRSQDEYCEGIREWSSPYCSCAPEGHVLCGACSKLADLITAALDAAEQRGESRRKDNTPKP